MPIVLAAQYAIPMMFVCIIFQLLLLGRIATFVLLKTAQGYVLTLWLFLIIYPPIEEAYCFLGTCV